MLILFFYCCRNFGIIVRDASTEVFNVLNNVDPRIIVERASVDEAFLDLTQFCDDKMAEEDGCLVDEVRVHHL